MDQEFDFPFDTDVFEDLDLYIAYQLQQELDFSNIHDSPPDLEDTNSVRNEQPHWVDSDPDGGDEGGEDNISLTRFAYDSDEEVDEEEEEVSDDESDQYGHQSPTPSDNSALTFSPDPSARNSPEYAVPSAQIIMGGLWVVPPPFLEVPLIFEGAADFQQYLR